MNLDILTRLQRYCKHFNDYEALNSLRVNFLKNKQDLEKVTCTISNIQHDDSKTWGEDGYYLGEKVEVKNLCFLGKTKVNGAVKFHDLSLNRVAEFESEPYWLVVGCYNYQSEDPVLCEAVYGFKLDSKVVEVLRSKLLAGHTDPAISFSAYKHLFNQPGAVKLFYRSETLTSEAYSKTLYQALLEVTA